MPDHADPAHLSAARTAAPAARDNAALAAAPAVMRLAETRQLLNHANGPVIQRRIVLQGDAAYRAQVQAHLQQLAGPGVAVNHHPVTGEVALAGAPAAPSHSHALLHRVIQSPHAATLRGTAPNEAVQAEPTRPRTYGQAVGDFMSDLFRWNPWGTSARRRNRAAAADPHLGAGATIPYNPNLPPALRQGWVANAAGTGTQQRDTPQHLILAHELIHADHYQRGTGAFTPQGGMIRGTYDYPRAMHGAATDQEPGWREEMNNIGIAPAAARDPRFDQIAQLPGGGARPDFSNAPNADAHAITENMIRAQHGEPNRVRYPGI